jgi:hypothetical protein
LKGDDPHPFQVLASAGVTRGDLVLKGIQFVGDDPTRAQS